MKRSDQDYSRAELVEFLREYFGFSLEEARSVHALPEPDYADDRTEYWSGTVFSAWSTMALKLLVMRTDMRTAALAIEKAKLSARHPSRPLEPGEEARLRALMEDRRGQGRFVKK